MGKRIFRYLLVVLFLQFSAGSALALDINSTPPDFTLPTLDGHQVSLSDFKGHNIVLKLGTTWCPTCRQEVQEIEAAGEALKKADAVVVEVFLQDTRAMVANALKGQNYSVRHVALIDDARKLNAYNVFLIPRIILINRNFKVFADYSGLVPAEKLRKDLGKLASDH